MVIETDASRPGGGAYCQGVSTGGRWALEESSYHINCLELLAGSLALKCFTKNRAKAQVLLLMDNISAVTHINKMGGGGAHPPLLSYLAKNLWDWPQPVSEGSIHSWDPECSGRPIIQSIAGYQQLETETSCIHSSVSDLGAPEHRPICVTSINPTGPVRELETRPLSSAHRHFHTGLVNISELYLSQICSYGSLS